MTPMHFPETPDLERIMLQASLRAAAAFEEMINQSVRVEISRPQKLDRVSIIAAFEHSTQDWGEFIRLDFNSTARTGEAASARQPAFYGIGLLVVPGQANAALLQAFFDLDPALREMEDPHSSILLEVGNVLLNACVGTLSNAIGRPVVYNTPVLTNLAEISASLGGWQASLTPALRLHSSMSIGSLELNAEIVLILSEVDLG